MTLLIAVERHGEKILAADTLATSSDGWGQKYRGVNKIITLSDGAVGICGDCAVYFKAKQFLEIPDINIENFLYLLPKAGKKKDWEAVAVSKDGICTVYKDYHFRDGAKIVTSGSGSLIGLGAAEALYDSTLTNIELLDRVFAIAAKNINTVGKFYNHWSMTDSK